MRSLLSAVLLCAVTLSALVVKGDEETPQRDRRGLPFEIALAGTAHLSPSADPCLVLNAETADGRSAALGPLAWTDLEVVNFCSVSDNGVSVVAQFTLASPEGDRLYGTFETTGHPQSDGLLHIAGTFHVVSGTGRFAGAAGRGEVAALAASPNEAGVGSFTGTLRGELHTGEGP